MSIEFVSQYYAKDLKAFRYPKLRTHRNVLMLVEEGECSLQIEGVAKPVILKPNEAALVPPGLYHRQILSEQLSCYFLSFHVLADPPAYLAASAGKLSLPPARVAPILQSLQRAIILPDHRDLLVHLIEHIFAENYLFGKSAKNKLVSFSQEITDAVDYMNKNIDQKIDMDELAARVYLSHSGLIWKFKKELGTTPAKYLNLLRLRYAKQLLLEPALSITQISEMCGYSTPFYFTNLFREYSGMSPSDFRKQHVKKE